MLRNLFTAVLLCVAHLLAAQYEDIYFDNGCNYANDDGGGLVTVINANSKAERIVKEILDAVPDYAGQDRNFLIRVANVDNARATTAGGKRYILLNIKFLEDFEKSSLTQWAAYSLMSHEIAHHVLQHDLTTIDGATRKRYELQADEFSGRVLARLGADQQDALSGIKSLKYDGESGTHPAKSAREQAIFSGYFEETEKITAVPTTVATPDPQPPITGTPIPPRRITTNEPDDFNLLLDDQTLKQNRWNLVTAAEGLIDEEKIRINFRIPPHFNYQPLRVCLLSSNGDVGPEVRLAQTIGGTGSNQFLNNSQGEIIWNYRMEKFTRSEVSAEDLLRVAVYREHDLPHLPDAGGWIGSGSLLASGAGLMIWGILELAEAQNIYQVYSDVTNPFDAIYLDESRSEKYDRANDHHLKGQYLTYGGAALLVGGGLWLYDKLRMKKTYDRDFCLGEQTIKWEPLLACNSDAALGLRVWF